MTLSLPKILLLLLLLVTSAVAVLATRYGVSHMMHIVGMHFHAGSDGMHYFGRIVGMHYHG